MKVSHLLVIGFTLAVTQASMALSICLHARKGHSFVTVQKSPNEPAKNTRANVVMTLGLWPDRLLTSQYPTPVGVNRGGDYPMSKSPDVSTCSELKIPIEALKNKALIYTSTGEYGPYSLGGNNCTHFAVRMFNYGSREPFPVGLGFGLSPSAVAAKIRGQGGNADEDAKIER